MDDGTTGADSADARIAAANAVAPDALTAAILAKHSAGEKLSPSEWGTFGAWKKKLSSVFGGKGDAAGGLVKPGPAAGHAPGVATVAAGQASADGVDAVPIDAGLVRRTTDTILTRFESIARKAVTNAAREANAPSEQIDRFDRAVSLPKDHRALMVDLAPDVAASMGLNPRHYPLGIFLGTFGLWATDIWLVVQEVKALKIEPKKVEQSKGG